MYQILWNGKAFPLHETAAAGRLTLTFPRTEIPADVGELVLLQDFLTAEAGDEGYFLLPEIHKGCMVCGFRSQPNASLECSPIMQLIGMKRGNTAYLAVLDSFAHDIRLCAEVKDGKYRAWFRLLLDGALDEDIRITLYTLTGQEADWSGMARKYRAHRLENARLIPLAKRGEDYPALAYACKSPLIRVRMGWKPVPTPVPHQTPENEPAMHVAMDFDRVRELVAELKRQGVEAAELQLVGWNIRGHDGRWPQIFPAEPALGGEAGLKRLVEDVKQAGYRLSVHTNSTDAYEIADCWDETTLRRDRAGNTMGYTSGWSGGQMYHVCPKCGYERFAKEVDRLAQLGLSGLHYIDCISIVRPFDCRDPRHPLDAREAVNWWLKLQQLARERLGGFSSEGGCDFAAEQLDYALYVAFNLLGKAPAMCDRRIPFWQLVYHGYILSNPTAETVNLPVKDAASRLTFYEYGGRPTFYYYTRFVTETAERGNWMGNADFICDTDEQLVESVGMMKAMLTEYEAVAELLTVPMDSYTLLTPEVSEVTYENGVRVVVNHGDTDFMYQGSTVPAQDFRVIR